MNIKNIVSLKKDYSWNPSTCIYENEKHLKSIADTSLTECDEIIIVIDNVSTKKTTITNVTGTASISRHTIKVRDFYIFHSYIINHITIDNNYCYWLSLCKTKRYNIKLKTMN